MITTLITNILFKESENIVCRNYSDAIKKQNTWSWLCKGR